MQLVRFLPKDDERIRNTVMAIANEAMIAVLTADQWVTVKVWGVTFVSMAFAAANVPMLMRHGLALSDGKKG